MGKIAAHTRHSPTMTWNTTDVRRELMPPTHFRLKAQTSSRLLLQSSLMISISDLGPLGYSPKPCCHRRGG